MPRPEKDGIDYYPLDVRFFDDKKISLIRGEFEAKGIIIVFGVLADIYSENGYYVEWDEDYCVLLADKVRCGVTASLVREVIKGCIRRSLFDERVFNAFGILTSRGIQKRYIRAISTRKEITLNANYFLLDMNDKKDVPEYIKDKITLKKDNLQINDVNLEINTQSKVKESKEEKSKEKDTKVSKEKIDYQFVCDMFNRICLSYPKVNKISEARKKAIRARLNEYDIKDFEKLFNMAEQSSFLKGKNNRNWSANFDWLIKDSNMAKVLDGNYGGNTYVTEQGEQDGTRESNAGHTTENSLDLTAALMQKYEEAGKPIEWEGWD